MLDEAGREQFEILHAAGMAAKDAGAHEDALAAFEEADQLALGDDDNRKRLDALQPAARALWSLGRYDEATSRLEAAADIAAELDLPDEQGIIISNAGRIAAVKIICTLPAAQQAEALSTEAVPKFRQAFDFLRNHDHLYFRFANAEHGSIVSAMARERSFAGQLVTEGLRVAFRRSPEPYDQERTHRLSRNGLGQLAVAAALIPLGDKTPYLARAARSRFIH